MGETFEIHLAGLGRNDSSNLPTGVPVADDRSRRGRRAGQPVMISRSQYERLARRLQDDGHDRIEMTFAEIASVIGEELPASASRHPAWWGSDPKHTQAVWLDAGYVARPDLTAGRVVFVRETS
ncbi:hypothetical protein ACIBEJ_11185 [Nonomuraea sp. NPDC050790]|uniref:DUF7662 domain-containing protein n=1 Tax=Nonomuraea sp. NPDC050790 TaxID=3364371 RepID=UPI0037B9B407